MRHLEFYPLRLPQSQKRAVCPVCGVPTGFEINQSSDACRLVCGEDPGHWFSDWDERAWNGKEVE